MISTRDLTQISHAPFMAKSMICVTTNKQAAVHGPKERPCPFFAARASLKLLGCKDAHSTQGQEQRHTVIHQLVFQKQLKYTNACYPCTA